MTLLAPREAYRLWAPVYEAENAITHLEQAEVRALGPSPVGRRLLDAGCGTGRRLAWSGAARATGVDLSPEMLAQGRSNPALTEVELIEGDLRALPLPDRAFDLVWCRLAIGHLAELDAAYAELARVAAPGATVIVTDFHVAAHAAGHRRTFRVDGEVIEVAHYPHPADAQVEAARRAGLTPRAQSRAAIGPEVRRYYEAAGRLALYRAHRGLPAVLALSFTRDG
jgi:malonyl-CoA O-methyltransferase